MDDVRLIDANSLKGNREWFDCHACGDECEIDYVAWRDIENAPTIDAVPVVRCMECIFRGQHDLCPMNVRVYMLDEAAYLDCTEDNGFCHMGAKMGGGAEE